MADTAELPRTAGVHGTGNGAAGIADRRGDIRVDLQLIADMVDPATRARPEVREFCDWVVAQAAQTRAAIGEHGEEPGGPGEGD